MNQKIATVTLNPAIDQTVSIPNFVAGEVNRVAWEQSDPGGKGVNVASFLVDFGYRVAVTGFLGVDNALLFERHFAEKKIEDQFVRIAGKTRVNIKVVDDAQQQITDINFPGQPPLPENEGVLKSRLEQLAAHYDLFVLSGSIPAGLSTSIYGELVALLKNQGKRVVLDTSGDALRLALPAAPYAIKPNIDELSELVGRPLETPTSILEAAQDLLRQGISCVVVSMGARGALFVEAGEHVYARSDSAVEIKSTVGAGDAMVAGIVTAKTRGLSLADCARLASAFSVGALGQIGPRLPAPELIESFVDRVEISAEAQW